MLDGVSLDQLRSFIAAVDTGSFSAAGRRLGRAQSVVSQAIATLERRPVPADGAISAADAGRDRAAGDGAAGGAGC